MKKIFLLIAFCVITFVSAQAQVKVTYVEGLAFKELTTIQLNALTVKKRGDTYFDTTIGVLVFWDGDSFEPLVGTGITPAEQAKLNNILITQSVNLDDIEAKANSALQSFTETDPQYNASQAKNITASSITKLANLSGVNTGDQDLSGKQDLLVSGTNIKTFNNQPLLGSGNFNFVDTGGEWGSITGTLTSQADLQNALNLKANNSEVVKTTAGSRIQNIAVWMGTKAQYNIDNPTGAALSFITDSLPAATTDKYATAINVTGDSIKTLTMTRKDLPNLTTSWTDLSSVGGTGGADGNDYLTSVTESAGILTFDVLNRPNPTFNLDAYLSSKNYSVGAHTVDTNTQLNEAQVDAFVANNGYSTGAHTVDTNQYVDGISVSGGGVKTITLTRTGLPNLTADFIDNDTGGGSTPTNLSYTASSTNGIVNSDTGTDATLPAGSTINASLMLPADKTKLNGIATGATANSTDATLLALSNHTGTLLASTISDFATTVTNNSAVLANTAKVTNSTHTGEVTGSGALTITNDAVTNTKLSNMTANTVKGRLTSTGDPQDLSTAQLLNLVKLADGTGSGLDADYLQGIAGSSYAVISFGFFTPTITSGNSNGAYTNTILSGQYYKVGKLVWFTVEITLTQTGTPLNELFTISGLPFAMAGSVFTNFHSVRSINLDGTNLSPAGYSDVIYATQFEDTLTLQQIPPGGGGNNMVPLTAPKASPDVSFSINGTYITN